MSYYFQNTASMTNTKAHVLVDYNAQKAAFLKKLGEGITNKKRALELRKELCALIEAAQDTYKAPGAEILSLYNSYKAELDKAIGDAETRYTKTFEEAEKVKAKEYVDHISPELDATVNSLALSYINQVHGMNGQTPRQNDLFKKALSTREGALALLRMPPDMLPSRIKSQAAEISKSVEKIAFESQQKVELTRLGRECSVAYLDGFHMREIRRGVEANREQLMRELSKGEGEAV